tara:strand:- start:243 stop:758 length:516 start_codon:yes stop_codon:yes gene_type:complete
MKSVPLLEHKTSTSVKQPALLTPLAFRLNLKPRFIQAELVVTERRRVGLMAMDQNHWNSAELIVLLQAIRSFNVLILMVTACVVQMMTEWRRQAVTCTAPRTVALANCPTLVRMPFRLMMHRRPFTSKVQTTTITATTELGLLLLRRVLPPLSTLARTVAHHQQHTMNIPQ